MTTVRTVRSVLRELVDQTDYVLWNSPDRYHQALMSACPNHEREVELVITAIQCEIVSEMKRLGRTAIVSVLLPKLGRWLIRQTGLHADEAEWTVNTWAMVLGMIPFADGRLPESQSGQQTHLSPHKT